MNRTTRLQHSQAVEGRLAMRLAAALAERADAAPRDVSERLRVAREQALARARESRLAQVAPQRGAPSVVASSGRSALLGSPSRWWQRAASVLPLVTLLLGLLLVNRMSEMEQVQAAAEIDAALLADTLPPDAYADPGFAEYLRFAPALMACRSPSTSIRATLRLIGALCGLLLAFAAMPSRAEEGPAWGTLSAAERQALAPLQRDWSAIDANRKQKWLEVAARFPRMPANERQRVQERMASWAALSPAERTRARLQFQESRQISPEERKAQWEAYRSLPEDERKALAQRARKTSKPTPGPAANGPSTAGVTKNNVVEAARTPPPRPVAPTVVQANPGATTTTMATRAAPPPHHQTGLPKIVATPGFVDPATLLPRRGPQGAAVRSAAASEPKKRP